MKYFTKEGTGPAPQLVVVEQGKFTSYLKFTVSGLSAAVQSAVLRLQVTDGGTDGGPNGGTLFLASNNHTGTSTAWTEFLLTSGNAPEVTSGALATLGAVSPLQTVEFDVTAVVSGVAPSLV